MDRPDDNARAAALAELGLAAAGLAHEVRNALGVARNCAYLLRRRGVADNPATARPLDLLDAQIETCRRLVDDALDLAQGPTLDRRPAPVAAILRDAAEPVVPPDGAASLVLDLPPDAVEATVDPALVTRVVRELVGNAVAILGPGGGTVTVRAGVRDGQLSIDVADDGPGFDPADADALFEPFRTGRRGGTGLGLAMVRSWARAAGGNVEARGQPGAGATFTVRLPAE